MIALQEQERELVQLPNLEIAEVETIAIVIANSSPNKSALYRLFRFIMAAYIVKCTVSSYRIYKDRVEYINIIHFF